MDTEEVVFCVCLARCEASKHCDDMKLRTKGRKEKDRLKGRDVRSRYSSILGALYWCIRLDVSLEWMSFNVVYRTRMFEDG